MHAPTGKPLAAYLQLFQQRQAALQSTFQQLPSAAAKYRQIIAMGRQLPPLTAEKKQPQFRVAGCQSTLYLHSRFAAGLLHFQAESDALISAGLAALLLAVYNSMPPLLILQCPPRFLHHLQIVSSLSPGRSNGLASLFCRMQQDAKQAPLGQMAQ